MDMKNSQYLLFKETYRNGRMSEQCSLEQALSSRIRDWSHKKKLDDCVDFKEKLAYWVSYIKRDAPCFDTNYFALYDVNDITQIELVEPVTNDISGLWKGFHLGLLPKTKEDRLSLIQATVDWYRAYCVKINDRVYEAGHDSSSKIAFHVQLFDTYKADLQGRLSTALTATHESDLLKKRLEEVSTIINSVRGVNNTYDLTKEIDKLRDAWIVNSEDLYDFTYVEDNNISRVSYRLALVWDIVHYEAYLKDQLICNNKLSNGNKKSKVADFEEVFIHTEEISKCVSLLRAVDPPLIGKKRNWTGRSNKAAMVGWIFALEEEGKIKNIPRSTLSDLLANYFPGLTIDRTTFKKSEGGVSSYMAGFQQMLR